jgi:phage protein U
MGQPAVRGGFPFREQVAPFQKKKKENSMAKAKMVGVKRRGKTRIKGDGEAKKGKGKRF